MIDKKELRQLAQAATPGPWGNTDVSDPTRINSPYDQVAICYRNSRAIVNAKFIAAANPVTVIELLDKIERLRRHIDALHGKGDVRHRYNGLCPDETQPDSRDDECPACLLLAPNAELSGRPLADGPA